MYMKNLFNIKSNNYKSRKEKQKICKTRKMGEYSLPFVLIININNKFSNIGYTYIRINLKEFTFSEYEKYLK